MKQQVFIGIDVHAKSYTTTEVLAGIVIKQTTMPAVPKQLIATILNKHKDCEIFSVYEAGFSGFALHRELVTAGIKNIIVNPSSIESDYKNKVKTDIIDSKKLALHLSQGRLKGIYVPSAEQELQRTLTRTRRGLVNRRTSLIRAVRMKLHTVGLIPADYRKVLTLNDVDALCANHLAIKESISSYLSVWKALSAEISFLNTKVRKVDSNIVNILKSVPGIGKLSAVTIFYELGDFSQFANIKRFSSYLGITPSEYSSGDSIKKGRITKQGKAELRKILVEAAHRARLNCPYLQYYFLKILQSRKNPQIAIVALAHKIAKIIYFLVKNNKVYSAQEMIQEYLTDEEKCKIKKLQAA